MGRRGREGGHLSATPAFHIVAHDAVGSGGGALVGLCGEEEGAGDDTFGGLDPHASVAEDGAGLKGIVRGIAGEDGAPGQLAYAEVVLPQLEGEHPDEHGGASLRRRVHRLVWPSAAPPAGAYGHDLPGAAGAAAPALRRLDHAGPPGSCSGACAGRSGGDGRRSAARILAQQGVQCSGNTLDAMWDLEPG